MRKQIVFGLVLLLLVSSQVMAQEEAGNAEARFPMIFVPHEEATLSAEVSSRVVAITRRKGEFFKKGEVLIELDRTVYAANRNKARAQLASAESTIKSKQSLFTDGTVPASELAEAKMNLALAKANVIIAEHELANCTIHAPYDGRVVNELINRFEVVQKGQPLIEIVDDHILKAQFLVPSEALPSIDIGQKVMVAVHETGAELAGKISNIAAVVDPGSGTVRVLAEVANTERTLRAGMRGMVTLPAILPPKDAKTND